MLTLAWVYRTGRDLLAPRAGLLASLLLSASVFFLAYMIHARAFTLVALCSTLCIWSYWRIVLNPRPTGMGAPAGLVLGSVGLLYSHYFSALFLPALGLFHLLFVRKDRRWRQPVLLLGLAALLATAQLPGFLHGLDRTVVDGDLHNRALSATALISRFVHFMTNGLVAPSPPFGELLLLALPLVLVIVFLRFLRTRKVASAIWLLVFTFAAQFEIVIAINEVLKVIAATRIRYIMPLWPLTALLLGAGLWRLAGRYQRLVVGLLALWLVLGAWLIAATDFRYELGFFLRKENRQLFPVVREIVPASDLLAFDYTPALVQSGWFYDRKSTLKNIYRYKADPYETIRPVHADYPYLWLLYRTKDRVGFADLPQELGRVFCERALEEWGFTLERYALSSVENCPARPVRLAFDSDIQLTAPEITIRDERLRLDAHFPQRRRAAARQLLPRRACL